MLADLGRASCAPPSRPPTPRKVKARLGFVVACAIVTAAVAAPPPVETGWKRFDCKPGGFSVAFPGEPAYRSVTPDEQSGVKEAHLYLATDGKLVFGVCYVDFPQALIDRHGPERVLQMFLAGFAVGYDAESTNKQALKLNGMVGYSFRLHKPSGETAEIKALLKKRRAYLVMAVSQSASPRQDAKRFFDSFEVAKN